MRERQLLPQVCVEFSRRDKQGGLESYEHMYVKEEVEMTLGESQRHVVLQLYEFCVTPECDC